MNKAELIQALVSLAVPDEATADVQVKVIGTDIQVTAVGTLRHVYYDKSSNMVLLSGEQIIEEARRP